MRVLLGVCVCTCVNVYVLWAHMFCLCKHVYFCVCVHCVSMYMCVCTVVSLHARMSVSV